MFWFGLFMLVFGFAWGWFSHKVKTDRETFELVELAKETANENKSPDWKRVTDVRLLQSELSNALTDEDYEKAAAIRDRLKTLNQPV